MCLVDSLVPPPPPAGDVYLKDVGLVSYLGESNVGGLLTEALTADVEAVLADETGLVGADAAVKEKRRRMSASTCAMFAFP